MNLLVSTEGIVTTAPEAAELGVTTGVSVLMLRVASLDGLAIGMRIAPCYPAPSASEVTNFITRLEPTEYFIKVDPDFTSECVNYSVSIYEPSSLTPSDIDFSAGFSTASTARAKLSGFNVYFNGDFSSSAAAKAKLTGLTVSFSADFSTSSTATLKISASRDIPFQADFSTSAAAKATLSGFTVAFDAGFSTASTATIQLIGFGVSFGAAFSSTATATATLTWLAVELDMNLHDVVTELLNLWGIEKVCNAPEFAIDRAVGDVNSSMQIVWNQASDRNYWSSSTLTLTLADGEDSIDLPNDIQNVVGPCRLEATKRPLTPIGTIGELETFADIYLDGEIASEPVAYHIERLNQSGNDPAKTIFRITPPVVGADAGFLLEVVKEAPRFTANQLSSRPVLPIPHRYVESLLLPIARYRASSFWLFNNQESKPTIDRDYQMAMEAIGMADPLPGKSGDNQEATK